MQCHWQCTYFLLFDLSVPADWVTRVHEVMHENSYLCTFCQRGRWSVLSIAEARISQQMLMVKSSK